MKRETATQAASEVPWLKRSLGENNRSHKEEGKPLGECDEENL